jgi:hypothetical protein
LREVFSIKLIVATYLNYLDRLIPFICFCIREIFVSKSAVI